MAREKVSLKYCRSFLLKSEQSGRDSFPPLLIYDSRHIPAHPHTASYNKERQAPMTKRQGSLSFKATPGQAHEPASTSSSAASRPVTASTPVDIDPESLPKKGISTYNSLIMTAHCVCTLYSYSFHPTFAHCEGSTHGIIPPLPPLPPSLPLFLPSVVHS